MVSCRRFCNPNLFVCPSCWFL